MRNGRGSLGELDGYVSWIRMLSYPGVTRGERERSKHGGEFAFTLLLC